MTEQDRLEFWTKTLNLPDFQVVHAHCDTPADPLRLTVVPRMPLGLCAGCRRATDCIHRTHESQPVKDLPIGPQAVELLVRTCQFYCPRCDRYFTPRYKELKGTRWLWQKNPENLSAEERQQLAALKERFPRLKQLVEQRESLRAIFEDQSIKDATSGASRLRAWMEQAEETGLKALEAFCKTMSNWLELIANYFVSRSSNGRTEGFNHGLRAILWRAFGMLNFHHFRLRVLDHFGHPAKA
jgi:transposase